MTTGPVNLTTPQLFMNQPGVKCVQANACPCRAANRTCTSGCPSENCHKQGPTRSPSAPRLTTNVIKNIEESQEDALTLCHTTTPVVFHQDSPAFSPSVLRSGDKWPSLPARADTTHAAPALTETAPPDPAAPVAVGSGKINSNHDNQRTFKPCHPVRPPT